MAILEHIPGGDEFSVTLEKADWKMSWREFIDRLKSIEGSKYDEDNKVWSLPESAFEAVAEWKNELLVYHDENQEEFF